MENKKEIKLTEIQFTKLIETIQESNDLESKLSILRKKQEDIISIILDFNEVDAKDVQINIDLDKKVLLIDK